MTNYVFFCSHNHAKYANNNNRAVFSQWYKSTFKASVNSVYNTDAILGEFDQLINGLEFNCCEQWMMAMKALMFATGSKRNENLLVFNKIMKSSDPGEIKNLGKDVANFDNNLWNEWKYKIVVNGNYQKFQNDHLKNILQNTNDDILVEAAHYDPIWGIGYSEEDALKNKETWGQNLLGKALMEVRDLLK